MIKNIIIIQFILRRYRLLSVLSRVRERKRIRHDGTRTGGEAFSTNPPWLFRHISNADVPFIYPPSERFLPHEKGMRDMVIDQTYSQWLKLRIGQKPIYPVDWCHWNERRPSHAMPKWTERSTAEPEPNVNVPFTVQNHPAQPGRRMSLPDHISGKHKKAL